MIRLTKRVDNKKGNDPQRTIPFLLYACRYELVGQLSLDKLAVQAGDICYRLVLRALSLASAGVGAVTEAKLLHLHNHRLGAFCGLWTALRQQGEL